MYGLVTIWFAALIASTTSCGAPIGGIASPATILPFGAGWKAGSCGEVPPVLGAGAGVVPDGGGVDVCPKAAAGSKPAQAKANTASRSDLSERFSNLFRTPAELADGLALKELARL